MSFKDIALPLAGRGIPVVPVNPLQKQCTLRGWPALATTGTKQILAWDTKNPDYNVACVGKPDGIVILDCDVKGLVARIEQETGQKIPATFTVRSGGKGCAHLYFKQTDKSREIGNRVSKALFDLKSRNAYVVGPGSRISVDGKIKTYDIFRDIDIVDFPDWLGDWTAANGTASKEPCKYTKSVLPSFDIHDFLTHYGFNYEERDNWYITDVCPVAGHKHEQSAATGFYYDGDKLGFYCFAAGCEGHLMTVGEVIKFLNSPGALQVREPYRGEIWSPASVPAPTPAVSSSSGATAVEGEIDLDAIQPSEAITPIYPVEIWEGTEYAEFAEICQKGNYIPLEFFIESIKTATGAVAGRNLRAAVEGGLPRFYTVLMNSGGSGKGTAIKYARAVYREGWGAAPLLWSPATKTEDVAWTTAGACQVAFSSAPGMQRTLERGQTRWLQVYEELSSMIESTKGDGYGESLLAAIRQLYDGEDFTTTATAKRDACSGEAQNSMLAATTPQLWEGMFAKTQSEGSGLFQRFNLIAAENIQRVGTLKTPILEGFSGKMTARVEMLQANPVCLHLTPEAVDAIDVWYGRLAAPTPEGEDPDPDEYGRLNVLAWRNALHLAWLRRATAIELKDVEKAIKLSDYQHLIRIKYKPATGDHSTAVLEERIRRIVAERGKVTERDARRILHANRAGLGVWSNALRNLIAEGDIIRAEEKALSGKIKKWLVRK